MKHSAAAAYIRQLCALGVGAKAVMPELLSVFHEVIPSHLNVFMYADHNGEFADICSEHPRFLELSVFFLRDYIHGADGTGGETGAGARWAPCSFVADPANCATTQEMRLMATFLPHIAHAMQPPPNPAQGAAETENRGLLIMRPPAHLLYASPQARNLAHFALDRTPDGTGEPGVDERLLPILTRLCGNLRDAFTGREAPPPSVSLKSAWGLFLLRAYWLESLHAQEDGLVGITIERHEPLSLHLLRNMRASGLTERQRELCLLLFEGLSIPAVSKRLRVSQHTIVDHLKKIYLKLDVHNRDELRNKLEDGSPGAERESKKPETP